MHGITKHTLNFTSKYFNNTFTCKVVEIPSGLHMHHLYQLPESKSNLISSWLHILDVESRTNMRLLTVNYDHWLNGMKQKEFETKTWQRSNAILFHFCKFVNCKFWVWKFVALGNKRIWNFEMFFRAWDCSLQTIMFSVAMSLENEITDMKSPI